MHVASARLLESEARQENTQLNAEGNQVGDGDRNGDGEPVKINLAQQIRVGYERARGFVDIICKITPENGTHQIEKERRDAVGRYLGYLAEDDRKRDGCEERLDNMPSRPQNGLLVSGNKVPPHEQRNKIAIPP